MSPETKRFYTKTLQKKEFQRKKETQSPSQLTTLLCPPTQSEISPKTSPKQYSRSPLSAFKVPINEKQEKSATLLEVQPSECNVQGVFINRTSAIGNCILKATKLLTWEHVTPRILSNINPVLDCSEQNITKIEKNDFNGLKNVKILDLSYNKINTIQKEAFSDIQRLHTLKLSYNNILLLDDISLYNLSSLVVLDLSNNRIKWIEKNIFRTTSRLKALFLQNNNLCTDGIKNIGLHLLTQLEVLNLSGNKIKKIEKGLLKYLFNLKSLLLSDNKLTHIDTTDIASFNQLENLDLNNNEISEIEWPNKPLSKLHIQIENNKLSVQKLQEIHISQNEPDYQGPIYHFSTSFTSDTHFQDTTLDHIEKILEKWGPLRKSPLWKEISKTKDPTKYCDYLNLTFFFHKLYIESPREKTGELPKETVQHVHIILRALEQEFKKKNEPELLAKCCALATDGISTCVDRSAINLMLMSAISQITYAQETNNFIIESYLNSDLNLIQNATIFINNISEKKIAFDINKKEFIDCETLFPDGLIAEKNNKKEIRHFNNLKEDEKKLVLNKFYPNRYKTFNIGDPVEDILLILNTLKKTNKLFINGVNMRFEQFTTLSKYLHASINYLLSKQLTQ